MKRISFEIALVKSVSQMECLYTVLSTCSSTTWTVYPYPLHTSHPRLPVFSQYDKHTCLQPCMSTIWSLLTDNSFIIPVARGTWTLQC